MGSRENRVESTAQVPGTIRMDHCNKRRSLVQEASLPRGFHQSVSLLLAPKPHVFAF